MRTAGSTLASLLPPVDDSVANCRAASQLSGPWPDERLGQVAEHGQVGERVDVAVVVGVGTRSVVGCHTNDATGDPQLACWPMTRASTVARRPASGSATPTARSAPGCWADWARVAGLDSVPVEQCDVAVYTGAADPDTLARRRAEHHRRRRRGLRPDRRRGSPPGGRVVGDGLRRVGEQPGAVDRGCAAAARQRVRLRPPAGHGRADGRRVAPRPAGPHRDGAAPGHRDGRQRHQRPGAGAGRRPGAALRASTIRRRSSCTSTTWPAR